MDDEEANLPTKQKNILQKKSMDFFSRSKLKIVGVFLDAGSWWLFVLEFKYVLGVEVNRILPVFLCLPWLTEKPEIWLGKFALQENENLWQNTCYQGTRMLNAYDKLFWRSEV